MRFNLRLSKKATTLALGFAGLAFAGGLAAIAIAQTQQPTVEDLVNQATKRSDEMRAQMGDMSGSTQQKVDAYKAQAQALTQGNRDRIRQGLNEIGQGTFGQALSADSLDPQVSDKDGVVYAAVSLSMPVPALRALVRDAHKAGVQVVIQGPVHGSFKQTIILMKSIFSQGELEGVAIDPRVFEQYHVERVPAFIAAPNQVSGCDEGLDCQRPDVPHDILRGNVTLEYALKQLSDHGDAAPLAAQAALHRLED